MQDMLELLALSNDDRLAMYRMLVHTRAIEETLILNRKSIPGPLLTGIGQEAVGTLGSVPRYLLTHTAQVS